MVARNKSNEIRIIRTYDAAVGDVWDAWTDPEQVAKWWGPRGFTLTHHSKELRPGGIWHYTMHGPDGTDYPNKTLYHEVEKHKKLVYDHGGYDEREPLFRVTVLFSEIAGGKTHMDMTMTFPSPERAEEAGKFIKQAGGNSTWDRLAEYLEKESSGKEQFVINRTFDAPIDVMFEMWTDPKHFSQWLPPTGFTMEFIKSSIKPGERTFWMMTNGADVKTYGHCEYKKIEKPHSIVYAQQFADEHGNVSRHPKAPLWPETMLTTVKLTEEGPDCTRVTVTWEPHGATTREELQAFIDARAGMTQGWTGSFDKLEALLASG
jgi:uncharacterized protein YndB with AHSA1/START domain